MFRYIKRGTIMNKIISNKAVDIFLFVCISIILYVTKDMNIVDENYGISMSRTLFILLGKFIAPCVLGILLALILSGFLTSIPICKSKKWKYAKISSFIIMILYSLFLLYMLLSPFFLLPIPFSLYDFMILISENFIINTSLYFILFSIYNCSCSLSK